MRGRTRRAILAAAAFVLARNRSATLADIAEAAGVGRSTLHRYFSDREELINAVVEDSLTVISQSIDEAALDQGPPAEAMRRLVAAMLDVADRLMFLWGDPRVLEAFEKPASDEEGAKPTAPVPDLIERGQAEGVFDPEVSADWIQNVLWAVVYTGVEQVDKGLIPRHGVYATVVRTFENGIRLRDS
ncbi:TetR/AcrR family transcriptional regulator [Streptosporangium fragile]|uniref:TetR/AcrR family transcriptional regulator n=1 Tax=Streptosporangium fragile TaxID=46186 RepID=A0ABN3W725_9ACTN